MDTKLVTKQIRPNEWADIIKSCKSGGMKVYEYLEQHGISRDSYYYWLKKVKEAALSQAGFVEMPSFSSVPKSESFVTQMVVKAASADLCINNDTPSELISRVLEVIDHAYRPFTGI